MDVETDINPTYQDFGNSVESLQDGKIDAAFVVAGAPTTAVTSLSQTKDVYLVSLDQEHIDALMAESPYYSADTISKDVYDTPEDVTTVAVGAVVIARDDVSNEDVYNFMFVCLKILIASLLHMQRVLSWIWSLLLPMVQFPIILVLLSTTLRRGLKFLPSNRSCYVKQGGLWRIPQPIRISMTHL